MAFNFGTAPAPSTSFGFGGGSNTTSTTSSFSLGGGGGTTSSTTPATSATAAPPTLLMPPLDSALQNVAVYYKLSSLLSDCSDNSNALAGQELVHYSSTVDLSPSLPSWVAPNMVLRQQLQQTPTIGLAGDNSVTTMTVLTPKVVSRILELATDLRLSEEQAAALYGQVSMELEQCQAMLQGNTSIVDQAGLTAYYSPTTKTARDIYFWQAHLPFKSLWNLFQARLSNNAYVIQATNILLQNDLVSQLLQVVQEATQRITQLQQEIQYYKTISASSGNKQFAQVHLLATQQVRQTSCEILLWIAYHSQWTIQEMAQLLDVIRDMSATQDTPCPFGSVPTPYTTTTNESSWSQPNNAAFFGGTPLLEKSLQTWQSEFVHQVHESGQTSTLQALAVLVTTAMATMTTLELHSRHSLKVDKTNFAPQELQPLHQRLNPNTIDTVWAQRPDVGGLLSAAYSAYLRSMTTSTASPRSSSGASPSLESPWLEAARDFSTPADYKSFSFAKYTLVPALQRLSKQNTSCQISEFALSLLGEWLARYLQDLPGLPLSRQRWLVEEEEQLQLRRDNLARSRQFEAWQAQGGFLNSATKKRDDDPIPAVVDLMSRPDCLDDIVGLAIELCALGPDYARPFWKCQMFLQELQVYQRKDSSLLPCYLSWLAALASNEVCATQIYEWLSSTTTTTTASSSSTLPDDQTTAAATDDAAATPVASAFDWPKLVANLRWYAQELSPYDAEAAAKAASSSSATTSSSTTRNTSYYYNLDGDYVQPDGGGATTAGSSGNNSTSNTAGSSSSGDANSSSSSKNTTKVKELSDASRYFLASHLAVLRNVAKHCPQARHAILSIVLPFGGGSASSSSSSLTVPNATLGDETLLILFKLAIAPLPPVLRGATLAAIASLLQPCDKSSSLTQEQQAFLKEQGMHAWDYLETCPLLPVYLLDQYLVVNSNSTSVAARVGGLSFPPSSIALATNGTAATNATPMLLPKDTQYGLAYEMEYVESQLGWYPSTEGCLELLEALVSLAGCPAGLGQQYRVRTGVVPYIEYVTDFVLPRAFALPFRVPGDHSRLVTKALRVVQAVLVRYDVPTEALKLPSATTTNPKSILGIAEIADQVSLATTTDDSVDDYYNRSISSISYSQQVSSNFTPSGNAPSTPLSSSTAMATPANNIPRAKSPGFWILTNLLSPSGSPLLEAVARVLADGADSIQSLYGARGDAMALAYATYGATPPNMDSAREGAKEGGPTKPKQDFLKALMPTIQDMILDGTSFDQGSQWREMSISTALMIFCAVAVREEAFVQAIAVSKEPLKIVPVLRFQQIRYGSSNLKVMDVAVCRLMHSLPTTSPHLRSALVEYIGYSAWDDVVDAQLSGSALALTYALKPGPQDMPTFLASAVASRLLLAARRTTSSLDQQSTSLILNWILESLRAGVAGDGSLVQLLLGLPTRSQGGNWSPSRKSYGSSVYDCFDSILQLLQDVDYAASKGESAVASMCLEIVYRLYNLLAARDLGAVRVVVYTAQRLRSVDFWDRNLLLWLSSRGAQPLRHAASSDLAQSNPDALHCMAWFLKGLACELNLLVGFTNDASWAIDSGLSAFISPQPLQCQKLLELLFGSDEPLVLTLMEQMPLNTLATNLSLTHPPTDALQAGVGAWPGPSDVSRGYYRVDSAKVLRALQSRPGDADVKMIQEWIEEWNGLVARNCAASHLSNAVYMMLDSATVADESFRNTGVDSPSTCISPSNLLAVAGTLVDRMLADGDAQVLRGMDSNLYPNATCSLANSVLLLVENVAAFDETQRPTETELLQLGSLVSRAITYSSLGDDSDAEAPTRHERTTVLASALSVLLRITAHVERDLLRQYRDVFLLAAKSLARLAAFEVSTTSNEQNGVVAILARSCLSTMIDTCTDEEDPKEYSFVVQLLSSSVARPFMDLLARMDFSISSLLQVIGSQPLGAEALINARVLNALEAAAISYASREAKLLEQIGAEVGGYHQVKVLAPEFLMGHLRLLTTLLASESLPPLQARLLPEHAIGILRHYKTTFQRLCYNFPFEGDILRAFLRCFVQAASLASPTDLNERYHEFNITFRRSFPDLFAESGFLESGLLVLCQQLLEYPMPRGLLPPPPEQLKTAPQSGNGDIGVVKVESDKQQSWWDVLEVILTTREKESRFSFKAPVASTDFGYWGSKLPKRWTENQFEYSIVAVDVLSLSLSLLKKLGRVDALNGTALVRGLHQYALASQTIQRRLFEVEQNGGPFHVFSDSTEHVELETEYLSLLGSSVACCVEELLVICFRVLTSPTTSSSKENRLPKDPVRADQLRLVLEQSGLESAGVGLLSQMPDGSERVELVKSICQQIILKAGK